MKDFLARLSSRKFLLTIGGIFLITVYPQYADKIIMLIVTYIGAEGAGDVVQRYQDGKTDQANINKETTRIEATGGLDAIDTDTIVPGLEHPDIAM